MRPTTRAALCGLTALAWTVASGAGATAASPIPIDAPILGRFQNVPRPRDVPGPWDGDASVTVEIGPRTTTNTISLDNSGAMESDTSGRREAESSFLEGIPAVGGSGDQGLAESVIAEMAEAPSAVTVTSAGEPVPEAIAPSIELAESALATDEVVDGVAVDGVATGGQTGARVLIGDTMGGAGEPGAPGGDATVSVSIGPITGGIAIAGEATEGQGTALVDDAAFESATDAETEADAARLGVLLSLGAVTQDGDRGGQAIGGDATGGAARGGDATVDIVIGDTIGGAGANGQPGGNAEVIIAIGPVTGGTAIGGAATGGDAIQGTGTAQGGSATGGGATGGDARVVIAIGDTVGLVGAGKGGDAAVIIAIGSVIGGDARGGSAVGGEAWGLAGIDAVGGDAAGGDAEGGQAVVELEIADSAGLRYEANVNAIIGGDATGGAATAGDAIDLDVAD